MKSVTGVRSLRKKCSQALKGATARTFDLLMDGVQRVPRWISRARRPKRVLGIFHLQESAAFLGDAMEFFAILNVIRVEHGLEQVDVCFVDDPSNPNRALSRQRLESLPGYKQMLMDMRWLLPTIGSTFLFNSDADFEDFFRRSYSRYVHWPTYGRFHAWPSRLKYGLPQPSGIPYPNTWAPLHRFFAAHGCLPRISCPPTDLDWARMQLKSCEKGCIPIAVQFRFNPDSPERNSQTAAWVEFLERMKEERFVFLIVCRKEEVIPDLRRLPNVWIAKDHGSTVLQDLALIQVARFSMFPDAGFATFPWFCGLPTILFASQPPEFHAFIRLRMMEAEGQTAPFVTGFQRRRYGPYDAGVIESGFWKLHEDLCRENWHNPHAT